MTNSKDFNVTTVSGKVIPRNQCRFIQKEYHEINVDCFLMPDNRWYRLNNGKIAFDHENGGYVIIEGTALTEGIVGVKSDGEFIYGLFSANPIKNIVVNGIPCISEEILSGMKLEESILTGQFHSAGTMSSSASKKGIKSRYSFDLDYSAGPKIKLFSDAYNSVPENTSDAGMNIKFAKFAKELNGKTFGFEFETSNGMIPERHLFRNGLIPLRDGSLKHDGIEPFEYATIPLKGVSGVASLVKTAALMQKYTDISKQCSLHLHVGSYAPSKEFVVAQHRVMLRIQDELYSMFPSNYKYTSENGFKQKDYCAPIKNVRLLKGNTVDQNFDSLYNYYSGGNGRFVDFGYCNHPKDEGNRAKWQVSERYLVTNIIPFIWGKYTTLEWRVHPPTQNIHKILNWLFICNGIMAYVEKYKTQIANFSDLRAVTLENILKDVYSEELASILVKYVEWRRQYMTTMDPQGDKELVEDLMDVPYSVLK